MLLQNKLSNLLSLSKETHFDFLKPSESFEKIQLPSNDGFSSSSASRVAEEDPAVGTDLWSLIIRTTSFFFIESRCSFQKIFLLYHL